MEQLWITRLLNEAFGHRVNATLQTLPQAFHPANPAAPITNAVAMELLVVGVLIMFFILIRMRLSVQNPGSLQHMAEMLNEFVGNQASELIPRGYQSYMPLLTAIFLFVLFSNLVGLIPGFESPTSTVAVPLGVAVVSFIYYHVHGIKKNGILGYAKHFLGPLWWMAPLMLVIEIVSHFARILSLTVRLWANIFAGDMVTMAFFTIMPLLVPVAFSLLHIFVSLLQAYVFMLLTIIYLQGAVVQEH